LDNLHNINIEKSLLSSIFFDPIIFDDVNEVLSSEMFYHTAHQKIYKAMSDLISSDEPIDEEFVLKELIGDKNFSKDFIMEVLSVSPLENITAYITEIKELYTRREILSLSTKINKFTLDENLEVDELLNRVQSELYQISQDTEKSDFEDSKSVAKKTLEHIEKMKLRGDSSLVGVDTGYKRLNEITLGFGDGDLIIVAARPAMGKTSLVLNMALRNLEIGNGVAFFSLEMPSEQIFLRLLSSKTNIPMGNLKSGDLSDEEWSRLSKNLNELSQKKFFVDDGGMLNINQVRSKLRKLKTAHPEVKIAIIDYLQLMSGTTSRDRHLEVSEISRGLKMLARELNMPIIALSQLNRSLEARSDKTPMLSDLRESGSIEQDADLILFVYRDDVYREREEKEKIMKAKNDGKTYETKYEFNKPEEEAQIIIGKHRNGELGTVDLLFQKRYTKFVDKSYGYEVTRSVQHIQHTEAKVEGAPVADHIPIA
jgi:replicative DNA helicase